MKKTMIFVAICINLCANNLLEMFSQSLSASHSQKYENDIKIREILKNKITLEDCNDLKVGERFYITRGVNDGMVIVASAFVEKKEENKCYAKMQKNFTLKQHSLPNLKPKIKTSDKILLNPAYTRALIIAPDQTIYEKIYDEFKDSLTFIHPDIFIGFLSYDNTKKPKLKHFQKFCNLNDIGLIKIALKNKTITLDCESFTIFENDEEINEFDEKTRGIYSNIEYFKLKVDYLDYFSKLIKANNKNN